MDRKEGFAKALEKKMLTRKSDLYISMLKYYADRKKDATDLCSPVRYPLFYILISIDIT